MRAVRPEDVNIQGAKRLLLSLRVSAAPAFCERIEDPHQLLAQRASRRPFARTEPSFL